MAHTKLVKDSDNKDSKADTIVTTRQPKINWLKIFTRAKEKLGFKEYKTPLRHRRCPESPVRRHSQPGPYGSQQAEPADAEHDVPITQQPSRAGDSPRKENADIYELKRNYCNEWSDSETEETRETLHVDREPHSEPYDNHHAIFQNAVYQAFKELRDEKDEYRTVKKSPYKVRTNIYQNFLPLTPPPTPCGRQPQIGTSPTREPRCTKRRLLPSIVSLPSTSRQLPRTYLGTGYYEDYRAYPSTSSHVYHQRAPERIDRPWEIEREDWRVREYEEDRKVEEYYEERRIKEYAQRVNREDKVSTKGKLTKDGKIPKKGKAIREEKDRSRDSETREDRTPRKKPDLSKYTDDPDYFKGTGQRDFIANRVEWYLPINEALIKDIAQDVKTSRKRRVEKMNQIDEHERKIIIEFCHLLEKSKQLFNGLRELPQYGHKQWHAYFGRTFDVYTKLWKFQQQHRIILDTKYGLKRWQIGEIASKIGQLYYHFYLRTSETAYLNEAFSFYFAIRGRCYYTKANKEDKCELMVKKLRYYARFIVVCLLLRKLKVVRELIKELERQIVEYGATYDPDDQLEWALVVDEVKAFLQAEPVVNIMNSENQPIVLSHRIAAHDIPPVERSPHMTLYLQEAVIVGSTSKQVKFSEMTMDMFRMLHALEREPSDSQQHLFDESPRQRFLSTPNVPHAKGYIENGPVCDNPHKNLLYKPSPMTVLTYLASGCQDLPPNAAMLLYISADGQISQGRNYDEGYDPVYNSMKNDAYRIDRDGIREGRGPESKPGPAPKHKEMQCLHPGDLFPFTRHPFFMIVDSDNSHVFQNVPRQFGQPLIVLMSPLELPPPFHDRRNQGSLFTMFLTMPQQGLCAICDEINGDERYWFRGDELLNAFMAEASAIFTRTKSVDMQFIAFFGDDYLRLMTLRFIFCEISLRLHRSFRSRNNLTRSSPPLPEEIFENPTLIHIVLSLATHYQIRGHFHDPTAGPAAKE